MAQVNINEHNYQMACGVSTATDAMQRLMDAGVPVISVSVSNGRGYLKTGTAAQVDGVKLISTYEHQHLKRVRALLCGCVIEWEETASEEVAA